MRKIRIFKTFCNAQQHTYTLQVAVDLQRSMNRPYANY